jgi:hypothetical protein
MSDSDVQYATVRQTARGSTTPPKPPLIEMHRRGYTFEKPRARTQGKRI